MNQIVINGDNIELLSKYEDNYFDAIVTDPPYGLGQEPNAVEVLRDWVDHGYHEISGKGFMGKEWDAFVPQPKFWKEVFRVLKHGGHVLAFYGTRTFDWGVVAMRLAGFEVRDTIYWHYGSGFPKSHNISKAIYKIGGETEFDITAPATDSAKQWDGWGSALKPASEPIVLARKPLDKGLSIAENVLKWGTGGINIDGCRVGIEGATKRSHQSEYPKKEDGTEDRSGHWARIGHGIEELNKGRFPANLIMTHHPQCTCNGTKKVKPSNGSGKASGTNNKFNNGLFQYENREGKFIEGGFTDSDGNETIEDWNCHEDCPIKIMDEQSGISKSSGGTNTNFDNKFFKNIGGGVGSNAGGLLDSGGASRFFYCAKASKSERNQGMDELNNNHPTVKPVKLMQYLVRLITPPNGKVLDPFCGSGTTGIACKLEGFDFVGMEQDAEYTKIAQARIENYIEEVEEPLEYIVEDSKGNQITQTSLF